MLECATIYGMPKLLACCEYHLATDPLQRFERLPASFPSGQVLPGCSLLRVAHGLRAAFHNMAVDRAIPKLPLERCDCQCCLTVRVRSPGIQNNMHQAGFPECNCSKRVSSSSERIYLQEYVPGPQEFLEMASA